MAINKDIWNKAKAYFELGKSLSYISDETGINSSSISKKAKKESDIAATVSVVKNGVIIYSFISFIYIKFISGFKDPIYLSKYF